jgi:hypothetical protein
MSLRVKYIERRKKIGFLVKATARGKKMYNSFNNSNLLRLIKTPQSQQRKSPSCYLVGEHSVPLLAFYPVEDTTMEL